MHKLFALEIVRGEEDKRVPIAYSHDEHKLISISLNRNWYVNSRPESKTRKQTKENVYPRFFISEVPFVI